jgi:glucose-6-phosphate isomerase
VLSPHFIRSDRQRRRSARPSGSPAPTCYRSGTGSAGAFRWSATGLSIAISAGWENFVELLAGAASIDAHFREAPLERNLPVLLALIDVWNARGLGYSQRVVVPYAHALALLPAYLRQLALESNGKSVARDGSALEGATAPALWGGGG